MLKRLAGFIFILALVLSFLPSMAVWAWDWPPPRPPVPGPPPPPLTANGLVWRVAPELEYDRIWACCGHFFVPDSHFSLNTATGMIDPDGFYHNGHGGDDPGRFAYDEALNIFFHYSLSEYSGLFFNRFTSAEFDERYGDRLIALQRGSVSSVAEFFEWYFNLDWNSIHDWQEHHNDRNRRINNMIEPEGNFAVVKGAEFLTDFIFEGFADSIRMVLDGNYWREITTGYIPMRKNNRWGIIDAEGNTVAPFVFGDILLIDNQTAFARYSGGYGILDIPATALLQAELTAPAAEPVTEPVEPETALPEPTESTEPTEPLTPPVPDEPETQETFQAASAEPNRFLGVDLWIFIAAAWVVFTGLCTGVVFLLVNKKYTWRRT